MLASVPTVKTEVSLRFLVFLRIISFDVVVQLKTLWYIPKAVPFTNLLAKEFPFRDSNQVFFKLEIRPVLQS